MRDEHRRVSHPSSEKKVESAPYKEAGPHKEHKAKCKRLENRCLFLGLCTEQASKLNHSQGKVGAELVRGELERSRVELELSSPPRRGKKSHDNRLPRKFAPQF